jgi:hypothetical protein
MAEYGNVSPEDVNAVWAAAALAEKVAASLPAEAPAEWRATAYELVLDGVLRDWVRNGSVELDEGDDEDVTSLTRLAADAALGQDPAVRDIAFRTILRNAMSDWVTNWNAEDDEDDEEEGSDGLY